MARIWMHNEMLELGDEKMSKSLGNIAPLSDVLDRWPAEVVIAFFLTSHYRSQLPFSEERMAPGRRRSWTGWPTRCGRSTGASPPAGARATTPTCRATIVDGRDQFFRALDDDFGTPEAFAALFEMVRGTNRAVGGGRRPAPPSCARRATSWSSCSTCSASAGSARGGRRRGARRGDGRSSGAAAGAARRATSPRADALRDRIRELGFEVTDTAGGPRVDAGMSRSARGSPRRAARRSTAATRCAS